MSKRTSSDTPLGRVSGAAFPSPTASEMYEMEYTEGISQQMKVSEKLKVAPPNADLEQGFQEGVPNASVVMQVPERIVVVGNNEDISFSRPADLDLIQSTPFKPLALKTPPRVLTLKICAVGRLKRECSMSENAVRQNGQLVRNDSIPVLHGESTAATSNPHHDNVRYGISTIDTTIEGTSDDMTVVDAENKERVKREMVMYSITVAFWLLNSRLWFRR
uniref:Mitochondrial fission factor n=1 Tax=Microcebus murinus TaxID=30608 RepID=A0A8C5VJ75_MICMU